MRYGGLSVDPKNLNSRQIKPFRIGDAIIILTLGFCTVFTLFIGRTHRKGSDVLIFLGSRKVGIYSLLKDTELTLNGPMGKTEVIIKKGQAWISDAPCSHQICRHMGRIRKTGQMLVCIPNRIIIKIEGSQDPEIDAETM
jgi:hypothetical protein